MLYKNYPILLLLLILMSCGRSADSDYKIFRYNQTVGIETTDPAFARSQAIMWIDHQLYNTLLEVDSDMVLRPSVARTWSYSADQRDITFILRDDVWFHPDACFADSTRRLTAHDVAYSFDRILDPETASNGAWIFNGKVDSTLAFEAVDDTTLVIHLIEPFQPILYILTMQYCSIVPHEAVEKYGIDFRNHPVGTGPFMLEAWDEGVGMTLIKNQKYWERDAASTPLPYIDGISINFVDNKASEFLLFKQGDIDFMNSIDPSFKDIALYKNGSLKPDFGQHITLYKTPYLNTEYFGFLLDASSPKFNPIVGERDFRQAVNYAVDRENLIRFMRNGIGVPATNGMIPPVLPGYDSSVAGYAYDPDRALQLLEGLRRRGYERFDLVLSCPDIYLDYANFVIENLKDVGIDARIDVVHQSLLREEMIKSQTPFFRASWIADYPDAESFLTLFYGGNPAPPNYTRYHNAAYDALYESALQTADPAARTEMYKRLSNMALKDAPMLFLYYDEVLHFVNKKIKGWQTNPLNLLELRYIDWDTSPSDD